LQAVRTLLDADYFSTVEQVAHPQNFGIAESNG